MFKLRFVLLQRRFRVLEFGDKGPGVNLIKHLAFGDFLSIGKERPSDLAIHSRLNGDGSEHFDVAYRVDK